MGTLVAQPAAGPHTDPLTAPSARPLGDAEWTAHLLLEHAAQPPARHANELLTRAHDQFKQGAGAHNRLFAHIIAQMAGEYMRVLDYTNARRLLVSVRRP